MSAHAPRIRRTQAERSRTTRTKILDATLSSLIERGYAGTSTPEVCRRARISRGALLHHFPTREELVICAITHLADQRAKELRARGPQDLESVLGLMWSAFNGPLFHAAIELWVAARSDPELHAALHPVERALGRGMHALWRELFRSAPGLDAERAQRLRDLVALTQHLLRGMALQRILQPSDSQRARLFAQWKRMALRELEAGARRRKSGLR